MIKIPKELEAAISQRKCIAFVGSGLSAKYYPSWDDLLQTLCASCSVEFPDSNELGADEYLDLAGKCHDSNSVAYFKKLREIFSAPIESCPETYRHLIRGPFKAFVTINFDPLLATRGSDIGATVFSYKKGMSIEYLQGNIFYIHGYVEEGGDVTNNQLVLTKSDFDTAYDPYDNHSDIHDFLKPLFKYNTVLFIGCGLSEQPLKKLLEITNRAKRIAEESVDTSIIPKHFLLLAEEERKGMTREPTDEEKEQMDKLLSGYRNLGINVIKFKKKKTGTPYIELSNLLKSWSDISNPEHVSPFAAERPSA